MEKTKVHGPKGKQARRVQPKHAVKAARKEHPKHVAHKHVEPKDPAHEAFSKAAAKKAVGKEAAVKFSEKQFEQTGALKIYEVVEYPFVSEKAVNMISAETKRVVEIGRA